MYVDGAFNCLLVYYVPQPLNEDQLGMNYVDLSCSSRYSPELGRQVKYELISKGNKFHQFWTPFEKRLLSLLLERCVLCANII